MVGSTFLDPPRSGEDLGRARHRTLGAVQANIENARKLRKEMSLPEVLLWRELRGKPLGLKFRKQFPVRGYVADFACLKVRLPIEIDGFAHDMGDRPQRDQKKDAALTSHGWHVLRLAAKAVLADPTACAASILLAESFRPLHPQPRAGGPPPRSGEVLRKSQ